MDNVADLPGEKERLVYITERSDSGWRCGHQYQKEHSRWILEGLWKAPAGAFARTRDGSANTPEDRTLASAPTYHTPPLQNYSNGPAGFAHEPGTALGASLRGHFILDQFPSGAMTAFQLAPSGTSFVMKNERVIHSGLMGMGLCFANNGGLLVADWSGGYPLDEVGHIWLTCHICGGRTDPGREKWEADHVVRHAAGGSG